ncbi:DUF4251 domain-containing protein [Mariniflexile sp.]|uniref:DUF4251 domain-containing protein n=1 Tax=Mariniflexile sp. TaxID=1979402 RepID=UPI0040477C1E
MKFLYFFIGIITITVVSCKLQKPAINQADMEALDALVKNRQFRIESDWANPQATSAMQQVANSGLLGPGNTANGISLIGNQNFLTISRDSISSYLPYFGERQMQVAYGGRDSGIEFSGAMKNYNAEKNKNNGYTITFEAKSNSENFNVYIQLAPNLNSTIRLNSASRFPISYSGTVVAIE